MNLAMLLLTIATVILAGGSLWAAVHYGRKALSEARSANALASERSMVEWQLGRMDDDNPGRFYLLNSGQDRAYDVTVLAWDEFERTTERAESIAPSMAETPHGGGGEFLEFQLPKREANGPAPVDVPRPFMPPGIEQSVLYEQFLKMERDSQELATRAEQEQVWVRVTWRSELGRWSSAELQTG